VKSGHISPVDHLIDTKGAASDALEAPNLIGEPSGTRTLANLIKSQETP